MTKKKEVKEVRIKRNPIRPRVFCVNKSNEPIGLLACGEHLIFRPTETKSITANQADFVEAQKVKGLSIVENASAVAADNKALVDEIASQEVVIEELTEKLNFQEKAKTDAFFKISELSKELSDVQKELAEYKGGSKVAEPVKEVKK